MSKSTSKPKLYLNVFLPVTTVFILNNIYLMTLETPGYLMINLITFGMVVTFSILSLRKLEDKEIQSELVPAPIEVKKRPRERFFKQGSLRSAYRV